MADQDSLLQSLRSFADAMSGDYDLDEMATELCHSVTGVFGVSGAALSVASDGDLRFTAASDARVVSIERIQEETQRGPCVDAWQDNQPLGVLDLEAEDRWPGFRRAATEIGFRSVAAHPLTYVDRPIGSVNVYSAEPREWTREDLESLGVLADMGTAYLVRLMELVEAGELTEQLQRALDDVVLIEQARGFLAGEHQITIEEASEMLRSHARKHDITLAELADALVNNGLRLGG